MKLYPAEFRYYKQALGCKPFQISLLYLRDKMNKASKKIALELWISWFCVLLYLAQMNEEEYFIHLESNVVWLAREYYIWTGFHFSVDSNYAVSLALHCFACWLAQKIWRPLFSTNQVKSKLIGTCARPFAALNAGYMYLLPRSDWFMWLTVTCFVIGQSTFGFGFAKLSLCSHGASSKWFRSKNRAG